MLMFDRYYLFDSVCENRIKNILGEDVLVIVIENTVFVGKGNHRIEASQTPLFTFKKAVGTRMTGLDYLMLVALAHDHGG